MLTIDDQEALHLAGRVRPHPLNYQGREVVSIGSSTGELEIGAEQGHEVRTLLGERFDDVDLITDLAGRDRVIRGRRPSRE